MHMVIYIYIYIYLPPVNNMLTACSGFPVQPFPGPRRKPGLWRQARKPSIHNKYRIHLINTEYWETCGSLETTVPGRPSGEPSRQSRTRYRDHWSDLQIHKQIIYLYIYIYIGRERERERKRERERERRERERERHRQLNRLNQIGGEKALLSIPLPLLPPLSLTHCLPPVGSRWISVYIYIYIYCYSQY